MQARNLIFSFRSGSSEGLGSKKHETYASDFSVHFLMTFF